MIILIFSIYQLEWIMIIVNRLWRFTQWLAEFFLSVSRFFLFTWALHFYSSLFHLPSSLAPFTWALLLTWTLFFTKALLFTWALFFTLDSLLTLGSLLHMSSSFSLSFYSSLVFLGLSSSHEFTWALFFTLDTLVHLGILLYLGFSSSLSALKIFVRPFSIIHLDSLLHSVFIPRMHMEQGPLFFTQDSLLHLSFSFSFTFYSSRVLLELSTSLEFFFFT